MRFRILAASLALLLGGAATCERPQARPQEREPRIVAIADIHGAYAGLTRILRAAGLTDAQDRWIGGTARLVQTGDFLDRGADVRQVMDLLMRLESEASRAGGRVDVLFGNHEGMNLLRDLRDVAPQAYAAFADARSEDRRRRAFDAYAEIARRSGDTADRDGWYAAHPPGALEYVEALGPRGRYGRWLRSRRVVLQVGDTIFMHAGLSPETTLSVAAVNRGVERELRAWDGVVTVLERARLVPPAARMGTILRAVQAEIGRLVDAQKTGGPPGDHVTAEFLRDLQHLAEFDRWALVRPDGPLWYRGLATLPEAGRPQLDGLLERYGASRFVVGHTPQPGGRVTARLDGRVVLADTGMLSTVYIGGQAAAVEIRQGQLTAIYPAGREPLEN